MAHRFTSLCNQSDPKLTFSSVLGLFRMRMSPYIIIVYAGLGLALFWVIGSFIPRARPFPSPERKECIKELNEALPEINYPMTMQEYENPRKDGKKEMGRSYSMHPDRQKFLSECLCKKQNWLHRMFCK
jgi:hypothetical protein